MVLTRLCCACLGGRGLVIAIVYLLVIVVRIGQQNGCGVNDVVVVDILGCILRDVVGSSTGLHRAGIIVHVDVGLQVHLLFAYNLDHRGGNDVNDVAVANQFSRLSSLHAVSPNVKVAAVAMLMSTFFTKIEFFFIMSNFLKLLFK